jgi:ABC-type phosphate transport system permease subunit
MMNIAPDEDRTLVIGLTQTLLGIVLLLTSLGGVVYGVWGFFVLAAITLGAHLAALILVHSLVDVGAHTTSN